MFPESKAELMVTPSLTFLWELLGAAQLSHLRRQQMVPVNT